MLRTFLLSILLLGASTAHATDVSGSIGANTTWSLAGSPYKLTDDVIVAVGATLTIDAGVEVRGVANAELRINGSLVVAGTTVSPVVMREDGTTWDGVLLSNGSAGSLLNLTIEHAKTALRVVTPKFDSFTFDGLTLRDYTVRGVDLTSTTDAGTVTLLRLDARTSTAAAIGVWSNGCDIIVRQSLIHGGASGVTVAQADLTLDHTVVAKATIGVTASASVVGSYVVSLQQSTFWSTPTAVRVSRASSSSYQLSLVIEKSIFSETDVIVNDVSSSSYRIDFPVFRRNVWTGSKVSGANAPTSDTDNLNYVALLADPDNFDFSPTERSPARYFAPTIPTGTLGALAYAGKPSPAGVFGFWYVNKTFAADSVTDVTGDMVIASDVTMTFLPGATLRMAAGDVMKGGKDAARIELRVEGTLEADGTNSHNVKFTAATPTRGAWYGILIVAQTQAFNISQIDIGYAVRGVTLESNDHVVAAAVIHDCSDAGVFVSGGTPNVESTVLRDNYRGIYAENTTDLDLFDVDAHHNSQQGARFVDSIVTWDIGQVYDNAQQGIDVSMSVVGTKYTTLKHLTIAHNGAAGVSVYRPSSSSYAVSLSLTNSAVTDNVGYGLLDTSSSSYRVPVTCSASDIWGNVGRVSGVTFTSDTCFVENPLYVDAAARNYAPTTHSPLRHLGNAKDLVGAVEYGGVDGPLIEGYLWEDFTFTKSGSPWPVLGDITVPANVVVAFEPGASLQIVTSDGMKGGVDTARVELSVLDGGQVVFDGGGLPITLAPNVASPAPGMWYGLRIVNGLTSVVDNARIAYARYGAYVIGPSSPVFEDTQFIYSDLIGFHAEAVSVTTGKVDVLACSIIGDGAGTGIELVDANARVRSSYVTHHATGIAVSRSLTTSSSNVTLTNNTIVHHTTGVTFYRPSSSSYVLNATLENNVIAANTSQAVQDLSSSSYRVNLTARNNDYYASPTTTYTAGTNSGHITSDPKVEDDDWNAYPRWWDGGLWSDSLAINAGLNTATDLPTRDILGRARKIGTLVDIGAWEFDPAANKEPRADACTASIIVPRGEVFSFDGSAAVDIDGSIASAYWTMSDGTVTAGQTVQHSFAAAGDQQWGYITVVDNQGAEDHALVKVNVDIRPIADAGPAVFQDEGPAEEVIFDGTLSTDPDGSVVKWSWNFGDGSAVSVLQSPRHSYLSAGIYTVTLTVTDNEGLTHSDTTLATVYGTNDTVGPHVQHTEIADGVPVSTAVTVTATITDPSGVASAYLYYRPLGGGNLGFVAMTTQGSNLYTATIPANAVTSAGVEYWFVCVDDASPNANPSTTPAGAPTAKPYDFLVIGDPNPPVITHSEIADGQTSGSAIAVSATITDATGVAKANLYFRPKGGTSFGAAPMAKVGATTTWTAQIPSFVVTTPGVEYYIEAVDTSPIPNTGVAPAGAPTAVFDFLVASGDVTKPIIAHTPVTDGRPAGTAVAITCSAADNIGVASVTLYYRVAGTTPYVSAALANVGGASWSGSIPGGAVTTAGVDYYLTASDASANTASSPDTAPVARHSFTVAAVDTSAPTIVHTPIANGQVAGSSPTVSATITDPSGVASAKLFYRPQGFPVFQEVAMTANGNTYTASIPSFAVSPPGVQYYLRATDNVSNAGSYPVAGASGPLAFTVPDGNADTTAPNIVHEPIANGQTAGEAVIVSAFVSDASALASVTLRYRLLGTSSYTAIAMTAGQASTWTATIPANAVNVPGVDYYLEAIDAAAAANVATAPASGGAAPYSFAVSDVDASAPMIVHTPVTSIEAGSALTIAASLTDDDDIESASLRWSIGTGAFTTLAMTHGAGSSWSATVPAASIPKDTTTLRYVIVAADPTGNVARDPSAGEAAPHIVTVADTVVPVVTVGVVPAGQTVGTAVSVSATVVDVNSVSAKLYYRVVGSVAAYSSVNMTTSGGGFSGTIPSAAVSEPGMTYYVTATDGAGNTGFGPSTAPATPATFTVTTSCSNECTSAEKRCNGNAVETCGNHDSDSCTEWGGASACTNNDSCVDGACVGSAPVIVINEVLYDEVGTDVSAFVELHGPAGTNLSGYSIVGVNGNGGADYNTIALTGTIPADGYYVVVKSGSTASILAAADQTSASADYQNGPDNIQLRKGAVVVDALGYGTFGIDETFAGEAPAVAAVTPGKSLGRDATATDSDHNGADFTPQASLTPGAANAPTITPPDAAITCPTSNLVVGATLHFDASGSSDDRTIESYAWSFGDSGTATGVSVDHAFASAGTFTVSVTVTDDQHASDSASCSLTITVPDTTPPTIAHTPVTGSRNAGTSLSVGATVTDASGVASAKLRWRTAAGGAGAFTTVTMTATGNTWSASIASLAAPGVEYWIEATDTVGNSSVLPLTAPAAWFSVTVVALDTTAPSIVHTSPSGTLFAGSAIALTATVTDAVAVTSVKVYYRAGTSGAFGSSAMSAGANNAWSGSIPAGSVTTSGVQYYLEAKDGAGNTATLPSNAPTGYLSLSVSPVVVADTTPPTIAHTAISGAHVANVDIAVAATVTDASGVASVALKFRPKGTTTWLSTPLVASGSSYSGVIPALAVTAAGIEYYLEATDSAPAANKATAPANAPTTVYSVSVTAPDVDGPTLVLDAVTTPVTAGTPVPVGVIATDPAGVDSVDLYYRAAGGAWTSVSMDGDDDHWTAIVPGAVVVEGTLELYVKAFDALDNSRTAPSGGASDPVMVQVDAAVIDDTSAPVMLHSPVAVAAEGSAIAISAIITDASGVDSANVFYRASGAGDAWQSVALADEGGSRWGGAIPADVTHGAAVEYYLMATDKALAANVAYDPADAPTSFHVIDVLGLPPEGVDQGPEAEEVEPGPEPVENDNAETADTTEGEDTTTAGDVSVAHSDSGGCAGGGASGLAMLGLALVLVATRRRVARVGQR